THDGCLDTTVVRCFSEARAVPTINGTLIQTNANCSTFTARATGSNLTNPQYCIYDAANNLVKCNTTGIFDSLVYGRYCVRITDGCVDTTMSVCRTFTPTRDINVTTSKTCTIGFANLIVEFVSGFGPFTVNFYRPNGSLISTLNSTNNPVVTQLPGLPPGQQYKVIGIDACGQRDTAFITPDASVVTKSISRSNKCPSAIWANGSGDLSVTATSNIYSVLPSIIKKNGADYAMSHSFQAGNTFTFSDLEPATYIVKYTLQVCNTFVYDTISIDPYSYPTQGQSALYVCDNNSFSLSGNVRGGISPYTFAIIGSQPSSPSIISSPQSSPLFNINNGTIYSLIRLRSIDACGNATLADVSVLPLEYISITASQTCFYQNITLSAPSIPNATYQWYRKTAPTDSVMLTTDSTYNLPFFLPEQTGEYICKVNVNGGCLVRLASYTLDGDCGHVFLPLETKLEGAIKQGNNQLTWTVKNDKDIYTYVVERKSMENKYYAIGNVIATKSGWYRQYEFTDQHPLAENNIYRLRIVDKYSRSHFSNIVSLQKSSALVNIYPNPVKDVLNISLSTEQSSDYYIELMDLNGRVMDKKEYKNITQSIITYRRKTTIIKGMYLLRLINRTTNKIATYKISFE
ncbi:MAG TPA: T9SS type A sorting domain-containing protein, partial [Chitinophagaceae bacterium]|nr:T9SS type A sorting domain-containing protein [Chitinophagaceae bacterium]